MATCHAAAVIAAYPLCGCRGARRRTAASPRRALPSSTPAAGAEARAEQARPEPWHGALPTASSLPPAEPKLADVPSFPQASTAARALPSVAALLVVALPASAQELSAPQQSVFAAFPAADGYQVILRNVDAGARQRVEGRLPFRVHLKEIGQHAVYVAVRGRTPLGIVYLRREDDAFGLTEVEWAITLDLRVAGCRFQRTRNRFQKAFEESEFARLLVGRSATQLAALIDADGNLTPAAQGVPDGAEELAAAMARSALKALTVIDEVWGREVEKLHDVAIGTRAFPTAKRFTRIWPVHNDRNLPAVGAADLSLVQTAVRAMDHEGRALGVVASVSMPAAADRATAPPQLVLWTVDHIGRVVIAEAAGEAPASLRAACLAVAGGSLAELAEQAGPMRAPAHALNLLLLPPAARPGR